MQTNFPPASPKEFTKIIVLLCPCTSKSQFLVLSYVNKGSTRHVPTNFPHVPKRIYMHKNHGFAMPLYLKFLLWIIPGEAAISITPIKA